MKNSFCVVSALMVLFSVSQARIINVPETLYPTIQAGIDSSQTGDTVLVAPGTYYENIDYNGKTIVVASTFLLDNDVNHIVSTIIDGSRPIQPDSASCVRITGIQDSSAMLIGFTLTGGRGTKWRDVHNTALYREGGGILTEYSSPTIKYNLIVNNDASDRSGCRSAGGGGIRVGDGSPVIENNVILRNRGRYGAGIVFNYSSGIVRNNIIMRNTGGQDYGGGGIWAFEVGPIIIDNNTFVENYGGWGGGGLCAVQTSIDGKSNIFWGNTASDTTANEISVNSSAFIMIYCDVAHGWGGDGNIDLDPQFTDDGYRLGAGSPCIDAGLPGDTCADPEDSSNPGRALWPSMGGLPNDMGAYGGPHRSILPPFGIYLPVDRDPVVPASFELEQNYPNPFNSSTAIAFDLPRESQATLVIYDLLGREVDIVFDTKMTAGRHVVTWQAGDFASGVYFYKLALDNQSKFGRMTLEK